MTQRRQVHGLLLGGLFAASGSVWPQQTPRWPVVGVLLTDAANAASLVLPAFTQGLQELGYAEGKSIIIDIRSAAGRSQALPGLATKLVRRKVDVA